MVKLLGLGLLLACCSADVFAEQKKDYTHDLDHKVSYRLVETGQKQFDLEVLRLGGVRFEHMLTFATRKAYSLCGGASGYSLTFVDGVETFDERRQKPNYIFPSLKVKIICP
ncbi:hypothetical protein [Colwellia sp. MEBiC06753]